MSWIERRPDRFDHECRVLSRLLDEGWVKSVEWHTASSDLVTADVTFEAGGQLRQAQLEFPLIYPHAPPRLVPRAPAGRWSSHQWGDTGELCLQIRADNWIASLDGAAMLRSARKLLDEEAAVDEDGNRGVVPAEHRFTDGQLLRTCYFRIVLSNALLAEVRRRGQHASILDLRINQFEKSYVLVAEGLAGLEGNEEWIDPFVPKLSGKARGFARIAVVDTGDARYKALTAKDMSCADRWAAFSAMPYPDTGIVIGLLGDFVIAKFLGEGSQTSDITEVLMDNFPRSPERNGILAAKRVAVLGCGSMGSKVATSLARMGVGNFLLVDSDLLKTGNLVRNELDWGEVGAHKTDGLTQRLKRISAQVTVDSWSNHLGGQTSVAHLNICLAKLKECDLIIETTGSGMGFVYAAAVATDEDIPMVWGRVFGGGFGGYIARSRPAIDGPPLDVRNQIDNWLNDPSHPPPPADAGIDYAAGAENQAPMIADDADVSVISAHLTGFSADLLRSPGASDYPYSAYVIGLRKEWLFIEPFQTHPVILSPRLSEADPEAAVRASGGRESQH